MPNNDSTMRKFRFYIDPGCMMFIHWTKPSDLLFKGLIVNTFPSTSKRFEYDHCSWGYSESVTYHYSPKALIRSPCMRHTLYLSIISMVSYRHYFPQHDNYRSRGRFTWSTFACPPLLQQFTFYFCRYSGAILSSPSIWLKQSIFDFWFDRD